MILFGFRNIKLKSYSYTVKELGITSENNSKIAIEYRQNYFHLFFIPTFPLNKFIVIEDSEEVGELSKNLENKIKSLIKKKPKAPWYTYLGSILIFIYISYISIDLEYYNYKRKQFEKNKFETKAYENINKLSNLNTNSYIKLGSTSVNSYIGTKFAKVHKINNDSILLKKVSFSRYLNNKNYNNNLGIYYVSNRSILDSFWFSKKKLKNAICTNYDSFTNDENSLGVAFFNNNKMYLIDDIIDIDNKIHLKYIEDSHSKTKISIVLKNYGVACSIVKIENLLESNPDNDITWLNKTPQFLETTDDIGGNFYLKGFNEPYLDYSYNFIIHLKSLDGEIHKFHIRRKSRAIHFSPDIEKIK